MRSNPKLPPMRQLSRRGGETLYPEIEYRVRKLLNDVNFTLEGLHCQPICEEEYPFVLGEALSKGKGKDVLSMAGIQGTFFYVWLTFFVSTSPTIWDMHLPGVFFVFLLVGGAVTIVLGLIALYKPREHVAAEVAGAILLRRYQTLNENNPPRIGK